MVHVAKRYSGRCPTHPGALLREDVIPATGRSKAESAQLLGVSRQHLYDILRERKPVSPAVAVRSANCSAMAPESGYACRRRTIPGMPNVQRISARFLRFAL